MMADAFTWSHLGVLVAFAGLCVTIWKVRKDDWKEIINRVDGCQIALAAFKLEVSNRHPTVSELADAERRFFEANVQTVAAINRLSDRIDRMLERDK